MTELVLKQEVYDIIGAAMEVYCRLGYGFLEPVYQEALEIELTARAIPFVARKKLSISYKQHELRKKYVPDFFCYDQIIAEIKVCERLENRAVAQLLNYLKATRYRVGLLINFGSPIKLEWKRYVF
jgi:GxxExxY protein